MAFKILLVSFTVLGQYSEKISAIAKTFPKYYKRAQYIWRLWQFLPISTWLYAHTVIPFLIFKNMWLMRNSTFVQNVVKVIKGILYSDSVPTRQKKIYPHLIYPVASLVSSLQGLISRSGFLDKCEHWKTTFLPLQMCMMVGKVLWRFMATFLSQPNSLGLMLNFDFFQPFKHSISRQLSALSVAPTHNLPCEHCSDFKFSPYVTRYGKTNHSQFFMKFVFWVWIDAEFTAEFNSHRAWF